MKLDNHEYENNTVTCKCKCEERSKHHKNVRKIHSLLAVIPFHIMGGGGRSRGISMFAEMEVGVGGTKAFLGPFLSVN